MIRANQQSDQTEGASPFNSPSNALIGLLKHYNYYTTHTGGVSPFNSPSNAIIRLLKHYHHPHYTHTGWLDTVRFAVAVVVR